MGSIIAFLSREGAPDAAAVGRMARAAPHRGEHVRLVAISGAVVATTCRSDFQDASLHSDHDRVVAFSGALDNATELQNVWVGRVEGPDPSPAEIVAAGIRKLGVEEAARRLRGVFEVVSTDGHSLWAFRDHIGFYPLVYREDARGIFVATEVKQIVAGSGIRREPDLEVIERILFKDLDDDRRCATAGVLQLSPAMVLRYEGGRITLTRYWVPESLLERTRFKPQEVHARFHELMEQAVDRCLMGGDVVSLSGGVDSPAVAAFAAPLHLERTGKPLPALSTIFPNHPSVDETRYIEAVAHELGMPLHTFQFSTRLTDDLDKWVRLFDGPVHTVAFGQVFEFLSAARARGFRNVLSGSHEEFVFEMRSSVLPYLVARGRFGSALRYARNRRERGDRISRVVKNLGWGLSPGWIRSALRSNHRSHLPIWLDDKRVRSYPLRPASKRWREAQLTAYQGTGIHLPADNAVQALAAVTERRPFADIDLVEFSLGLPAEIKHGDLRPKGLLRSLLRGKVPDLILDRKDKTVFDTFIAGTIDYAALRRWLLDPPGAPIPGVNYGLLAERLEREELTLHEYMRAKDLACIHAFLSLWENGPKSAAAL